MLDDIVRIAEMAGRQIMGVAGRAGASVIRKQDDSPLTIADALSHETIVAELGKISRFPILSEEAVVEYGERQSWGRFWLVDPLDGTKDFLANNGEFCVSIALIEVDAPVLGVIHVPASGNTYTAQKGRGAAMVEAGRITPLPERICRDPIVTRSRFHDVPRLDRFMEINGLTASVTVGSALKFAWLARGLAGLYPRFTGSKEWDIAAGHLLVMEAGGSIADLTTGQEPRYNKPDLRNNFFLACSRGTQHDRWRIPGETA